MSTFDRPFRLRILDAMQAALKAGVPGVGENVFVGRRLIGDDEPLPMLTILEPPVAIDQVQPDAEENPRMTGEWDVIVQGWANDQDLNDPLAHAYTLAANTRAVLTAEKTRVKGRTPDALGLGSLSSPRNNIVRMRVGATVTRPADATSVRASFYLPVNFTLAEDILAPFE